MSNNIFTLFKDKNNHAIKIGDLVQSNKLYGIVENSQRGIVIRFADGSSYKLEHDTAKMFTIQKD